MVFILFTSGLFNEGVSSPDYNQRPNGRVINE
jgi:hypothetical protein